jgi:protein-disulfide isomerase
VRVLAVAVALLVGASSAAGGPKAGVVERVEHRDPLALPSRGPPNALVTIELFFTPFKSSNQPAYRAIEKLQAAHPSRIRLVYRIVDSGGNVRLSRAAIYAFTEGKFFEFMDQLNATRMVPDDKALADIAKKTGLDADRMLSVISRPPAAYETTLKANEKRRQQRFRGNPPPPNALFNGRLTQTHTTALGASDLEREYQSAKVAAEDLLDHGVPLTQLSSSFEEIPNPLPKDESGNVDIPVQPGAIDDGSEDLPDDPVLASPPLSIAGWPSYGNQNADITIIVLCSPTSGNCRTTMKNARDARGKYPDEVKVIWAPYFKVDAEDAADLSLLADAALCAEKVGTTLERDDSAFDDDASPGWRWVEAVLTEANSRRRELDPEQIIDKVATKLHVDKRAFAACRAQIAGTSVTWIEAARHAGVRATPSTVVGGRIYGPVNDLSTLQLLVEAELAPGLLAPSWMHPDDPTASQQ